MIKDSNNKEEKNETFSILPAMLAGPDGPAPSLLNIFSLFKDKPETKIETSQQQKFKAP